MKSRKILMVAGLLVAAGAMTAAIAASRMTRYATSTSDAPARVVFGPARGSTLVSHVAYSCDKALGKLTFKARQGNALVPSKIASTVVDMDNTGFTLTNNHEIVWVYATGATPEFRTIASATTTNVTLNAALDGTGTVADRFYRVTTQGVVVVGANNAAAGTNSIGSMSGSVFATPGNSPLVVELESTTNSAVQVTVEL